MRSGVTPSASLSACRTICPGSLPAPLIRSKSPRIWLRLPLTSIADCAEVVPHHERLTVRSQLLARVLPPSAFPAFHSLHFGGRGLPKSVPPRPTPAADSHGTRIAYRRPGDTAAQRVCVQCTIYLDSAAKAARNS